MSLEIYLCTCKPQGGKYFPLPSFSCGTTVLMLPRCTAPRLCCPAPPWLHFLYQHRGCTKARLWPPPLAGFCDPCPFPPAQLPFPTLPFCLQQDWMCKVGILAPDTFCIFKSCLKDVGLIHLKRETRGVFSRWPGWPGRAIRQALTTSGVQLHWLDTRVTTLHEIQLHKYQPGPHSCANKEKMQYSFPKLYISNLLLQIFFLD